ncbi:hypothetical protein HanPSC8_Chr13g0559231 [Helianthus annuus]|nr:hypothetical protein HanPSC8_Chr13g0559231 [Helianthus annuus]
MVCSTLQYYPLSLSPPPPPSTTTATTYHHHHLPHQPSSHIQTLSKSVEIPTSNNHYRKEPKR